jgi:hypothetical protein
MSSYCEKSLKCVLTESMNYLFCFINFSVFWNIYQRNDMILVYENSILISAKNSAKEQ